MRQYTKTYRITLSESQAEKMAEIKRKYNVMPTKIIRDAIDKSLSEFKTNHKKERVIIPF